MKPMPGSKRNRVAVLGGGAHTIPTYQALLTALSGEFEIVLFSEFAIQERGGLPYRIVAAPALFRNQRIRMVLFALQVLTDFIVRRFHLIHAHSTYPSGRLGILIKRLFKTRMVLSLDGAEFHADRQIGFGDLLIPRRLEVNKRVCMQASIVTALSRFQADSILSTAMIPAEQLQIIPRGVVGMRIGDRAVRSSPIRFLAVGYLHPVKDYATLLRAFQIIASRHEAVLTVIGKDYQGGAIQRLAHEMGLSEQVRFAGHIPHDQMPGWYERSDFLLHASRYESYGMAVAEAMASGVLVCGTHVGLMADLSGSCCRSVPVGDFAQLAGQVLQLLENPEEQVSLRQRALAWSAKHALEWTTSQYAELYREQIALSGDL